MNVEQFLLEVLSSIVGGALAALGIGLFIRWWLSKLIKKADKDLEKMLEEHAEQSRKELNPFKDK